jgi:hypothetical protein
MLCFFVCNSNKVTAAPDLTPNSPNEYLKKKKLLYVFIPYCSLINLIRF